MTFSALLQRNGWEPDDFMTINRIQNGNWQSVLVPAGAAVKIVEQNLIGVDAWYSVCPLRRDMKEVARAEGRPGSRGLEVDVVGLRALWTDLDFKENGLGGVDACLDLINAVSRLLGWETSAIVHSGNGLHPYWMLEREEGVTDWAPGDRDAIAAAKKRVESFGRLVQQEARRVGGKVDSVHDLARVLRIPGTGNTKGDKK